MTITITVVTSDYVIAVADRRLTAANNPAHIVTERSTKITAFACKDARGTIAYDGVGQDARGVTPSDWLSEIDNIGDLTIESLVQRIRILGNQKLDRLRRDFGYVPRHTFSIGADQGWRQVGGVITNFEPLEGDVLDDALPELSIDLRETKKTTSYLAFATGDASNAKAAFVQRLAPKVKARAPDSTVLRMMLKTAKDAAYKADLKGSVGPSFQSVTWLAGNPGAQSLHHTPGGSRMQEFPNLLLPGASYKDIRLGKSKEGEPPPWPIGGGSPVPIRPKLERKCANPICRAPVPFGYLRCGVCNTPVGT